MGGDMAIALGVVSHPRAIARVKSLIPNWMLQLPQFPGLVLGLESCSLGFFLGLEVGEIASATLRERALVCSISTIPRIEATALSAKLEPSTK